MIVVTADRLEGYEIVEYLGIVHGENVNGINFMKDFGAGLRNIFGGRASGYENEVISMREDCTREMVKRAEKLGADGIIGVSYDYDSIGEGGQMLMLNVSGTAVRLRKI